MHIKKIIIKNYRSIKFAEVIPSKLNIFVGQNNHGKTNLFEAVEWFFESTKRGESLKDIRYGRIGDEEIRVDIEFEGAQEGAARMKNESGRTKMKNVLGEFDNIIVIRSSVDEKKRTLIVDGKSIDKPPTGFDAALNDFLPRFEYVDTKKYFEDVAKFTKSAPIGMMLSGVLTTILETSGQYQEFHKKFEELFGSEESDVKIELDKLSGKVKAYLEKQFPDCTKVKFEVSPPIFEDLLKNFDTEIDDGIITRASEKGDGMQRALMLAILQAYADFRKENEDFGKSFIFFIDEAELHLHPTAQRNLKNVLLDLSTKGDQIFLNTHSSVLVADEHENQKIFKVEKIEKETYVSPIKEFEKSYVIYELLGGSPNDLLLPRNFLIVEGRCEIELITRIIERHYPGKNQIQLVQAGGDVKQIQRSLNCIEQLFKPLEKSIYGDRVVILCDEQNNKAGLQQFLNSHPKLKKDNRFFQLPVGSIEEYYPDCNGWRKTADEVKAMDKEKKLKLAKNVGTNIDKNLFENNMQVVFEALEKCWGLSF
jgi:predicted ATP-dependent endonuclease of OLD family